FSTGRGRPVKVSAEALTKVSHMFDGAHDTLVNPPAPAGDAGHPTTCAPPVSAAFSTGRGRPVKVSAEAL
ncbi:unnamed protein product, partial [Sphacelaria rigidula]